MLVLSRKLKQEILVGDNVKITVLKIKGNTVRLGIEAPREVHVVRGELARKDEMAAAAQSTQTEPDVAEFTVVFSNTNEEQGPKIDVIPFEQNEKTQSNPKRTNSDCASSIQFHETSSQVHRHNRLKQIVNQLTSNS